MPGQFINTSNSGGIRLVNTNNQGSIAIRNGAPSFTITSADFTSGTPIYQGTIPQGTNGVDGFVNTIAQTWLYEGYYGQGLTPSAVNAITAVYNTIGLNPNSSQGYVWNVTWGPGSSITNGLVKFGFYGPGSYFDIQTIDPTDTNWQTNNTQNGTVLTGTFLFPATFTIYLPLTDKNGWC